MICVSADFIGKWHSLPAFVKGRLGEGMEIGTFPPWEWPAIGIGTQGSVEGFCLGFECRLGETGSTINYLYWGGSTNPNLWWFLRDFSETKVHYCSWGWCHIMTPVFCLINARASKATRLMVTWWKRWVRVQVLRSWACWLGDCCCIVRSFLKDAQWCWLPMMLHTKQVGFQPGMDGWQDE